MSHQQPYGQQPPPQGGYYYQQPPGGAPPPGQYQQPPPGQYQQPPPGAPGAPPPGQYGQQQPGAPPGQYQQPYGQPPQHYQQAPPQGYPGQPPPQGYPGQAPPQGYPPQGYPPAGGPPQQWQGQPPQQYGQPPPGQGPPPQQYGAPQGQPPYGQQPYGTQQWQPYGQQPPAPPAPASAGYDQAQKQWVQHVDTSADVEGLRKAMKGMGCDEAAIIKIITGPKYQNPWAIQQLTQDYNKRFIRDLEKDIKSETRGDLEDGILAILRGPLANDVRTLDKAMDRAGTDEAAVADVLLGRSNADVRAIAAEYRRVKGRELLTEIKDEFNADLYRLYSMVLGGTRAEPGAPVIAAEIDSKVSELHQATEGVIGANAVAVAQIFASSSDAQVHAMNEAYRRKYHRGLQDVIEKEFRGDIEDALLHMLLASADRARSDAEWLRQPLARKFGVKNNLFIYRVSTLYWDKGRLDAAKEAYKKHNGKPLAKDVKEFLSGDYEDLVLALIGEKKK